MYAKRLPIAVLALFVAAMPASAQPPADAARVAAARELITSMGADAQFDTVIDTLLGGLRISLRQQRPSAGAEIDDVMKRLVDKFKSRRSEVTDLTAPIYAEHFTVAELKELTAFYATPIGRKMVTSLPSISKRSIEVGMRWGQNIGREAAEEAKRELKKRGIDL